MMEYEGLAGRKGVKFGMHNWWVLVVMGVGMVGIEGEGQEGEGEEQEGQYEEGEGLGERDKRLWCAGCGNEFKRALRGGVEEFTMLREHEQDTICHECWVKFMKWLKDKSRGN